MANQILEKTLDSADKAAPKVGLGLSFTIPAGLAAFFGTLKDLPKAAEEWTKFLFGVLGGLELINFLLSCYVLARMSEERFSQKYNLDISDKDFQKKYWQAVYWARLKVLAAGTILALVGTVVAGGTFLGIAAIAATAPFIFIGVSAIQIAHSLAQIYRFRDTFSAKLAGKPLDAQQKEEWRAIKAEARNIIINAVLIAAIALVLISAPYSFPTMAVIATGVITGIIGYRLGKRAYEYFYPKPSVAPAVVADPTNEQEEIATVVNPMNKQVAKGVQFLDQFEKEAGLTPAVTPSSEASDNSHKGENAPGSEKTNARSSSRTVTFEKHPPSENFSAGKTIAGQGSLSSNKTNSESVGSLVEVDLTKDATSNPIHR